MPITILQRNIKKLKKNITIPLILMTSAIVVVSHLAFIQYQVQANAHKQQRIVKYLNENAKTQESDKIKTHAVAIQLKIDKYKKSGNLSVDMYAINIYSSAFRLASDGNKACYLLEVFADDYVEAYYNGLKDGKKFGAKFNNSF